MEEAIDVLTTMMIKEHFENNGEAITISKENLIKFCIKLLNIVKNEK